MLWQKIRSGVMFVLSAITCPCHLPIVLPLALALSAGTPAAVWITQNVSWVYGGMTILFLVSLAVGLRWMGQANAVRDTRGPIKLVLNAATDKLLGAPLIILSTFFSRLGRGTRFWEILRGRGFEVSLGSHTLYLHTTSLFSGLLLIGVGYLLASGQLTLITRLAAGNDLSL